MGLENLPTFTHRNQLEKGRYIFTFCLPYTNWSNLSYNFSWWISSQNTYSTMWNLQSQRLWNPGLHPGWWPSDFPENERMSPENRPKLPQEETSLVFQPSIFRGEHVSFRGGVQEFWINSWSRFRISMYFLLKIRSFLGDELGFIFGSVS